MAMCDHTVGVRMADDGDFLVVSMLPREVKRLRAAFAKWKINEFAHPNIVAIRTNFSDADFVREQYICFDYCPDCGTKLDLEQLLRDAR